MDNAQCLSREFHGAYKDARRMVQRSVNEENLETDQSLLNFRQTRTINIKFIDFISIKWL